MPNVNLQSAKMAKRDEFYTQWVDIEREMNAYLEYDPDVFRGKSVLLPCDDPEWSNFTKYFALHFADFGLAKLVSTSYAPESNFKGAFYQPTLFETGSSVYDPDRSRVNGRVFTLVPDDLTGDGVINIDDLRWDYLEGDGDFRSAELTRLRDEADVVITNPPFSLWREFLAWLIEGGKKFAIIGPKNAITYKEVFPHIKHNRMWLGVGFSGGDAYFRVPDSAEPDYADGVFDDETRTVHFRNVAWFTSLDHGRRHEPLQLMTKADNIRFSRHKDIRGTEYQRYENFDAIEVPYVDAIPSDHDGIMGVPITFLEKYDPDQFEIIANGDDRDEMEALGVLPLGPEYVANVGRRKVGVPSTKKAAYKRILIRHRAES